jgi:5-methyltetrahydropteroyltriglutamate--homocysteine methyltransferase
MNRQFLGIIMDGEPFSVGKEGITELEMIEPVARSYLLERGERLRVRICVTGPVELCRKQFGCVIFSDVLYKIAECINKLIKNSIAMAKSMDVFTICIDEPSMGIDPGIVINEEDMTNALEIASSDLGRDVEIHLHSPTFYDTVCEARGIGIIGIESASNPSYLDIIDKKDLERHDKFLRVGVSRTDVYKMAAEYAERFGKDVWKNEVGIEEMVDVFEKPEVIRNRLERAYRVFGERIRYAGPDCGLGSWPSQHSAFELLRNTANGIFQG